ncbi:Probable type I restriction enzyme BthVORF4518P M protein [Stutzerimonas stutzeri]|jgi:N-6 DNA methylase family protein|nr:N-6 DNA methylase [Haemophilus parainfluenzae]MDU6607781.1 N-6 DNA methylase [Haemophilus parainfluenzae]VTM25094.1 Probable type I restriction enzyme BthVORF4518P M protein [Stutzerimonas stutzeri]
MSQSIIDFIALGIKHKLISISSENRIEYLFEHHSRNFSNPEEQVQAEIYCRLILQYGYPKEQIRNFVSVTMGSSTKEADIVVYSDAECQQPHILVECKKAEVSEAEFIQAVNQAYSYAYALPNNVKYIWVTSSIKNEYLLVDKSKDIRSPIPDIPSYGINKLAPYKFVKDANDIQKEKNTQHFFDLKTVNEIDLTRRFKQAHNALWAGGQLNPSEAFDELDKLIFCKILDERKLRKKGAPYDFQIILNFDEGDKKLGIINKQKNTLELYKRVTNLYEEGRAKDPEVFKDNIRLSPERVRTIVGYLQDVNLSKTDLDSKGRAFETFMGSFFRGEFGQFFTPRRVVKFIVDVLPITHDSFVLDTSCGSGGFLLHALDKIRREADEYYKDGTPEHHRHWHDFAEKKLYGIEINEQISRAAKMNMIIHDDGHTNVISADGLLSDIELQNQSNNIGFKYNHFDFIITNPPFGSTVKQTEKAYLSNYGFGLKDVSWLDIKKSDVKNRDSQATEILFIEQCHNFLKPNGYLAIVIPDGILTNSSLQYVRDSIEEKFRIIAVISLPQTAFKATGAGVKSSVLFLRKYEPSETDRISNLKKDIQNVVKNAHNFEATLKALDSEKKTILKNATGANFEGDLKVFKETAAYKEWKNDINSKYGEKITELKEALLEDYLARKRTQLPNYPIFMAIAEHIGYDATGKDTAINELDTISLELARFIEGVNNGEF